MACNQSSHPFGLGQRVRLLSDHLTRPYLLRDVWGPSPEDREPEKLFRQGTRFTVFICIAWYTQVRAQVVRGPGFTVIAEYKPGKVAMFPSRVLETAG